MKKILFLLISGLVVAGSIYILAKRLAQEDFSVGGDKLQVITTLYPLYDFARNVGQDKIRVSLLLPPGVEPHSFEPKPNDVVSINQADLFVYTGKFMEVWAQDVIEGVTNKNLKVVDASDGVTLIPAIFVDKDEPAGSSDPHIWLDFDNAGRIVDNIANGLAEKDPVNSDFYMINASNYKKRLQNLDEEYKQALSSCKVHEIVYGGHYAFGYLAKRYGLTYVAAQGLSPNSEPTASDLAALVEQIKKGNIKYVFYEELTSDKIAQTIAGETGAKLLLLNPGANISKKDLDNGTSFLSIMEENLDNLKTGLECSPR